MKDQSMNTVNLFLFRFHSMEHLNVLYVIVLTLLRTCTQLAIHNAISARPGLGQNNWAGHLAKTVPTGIKRDNEACYKLS